MPPFFFYLSVIADMEPHWKRKILGATNKNISMCVVHIYRKITWEFRPAMQQWKFGALKKKCVYNPSSNLFLLIVSNYIHRMWSAKNLSKRSIFYQVFFVFHIRANFHPRCVFLHCALNRRPHFCRHCSIFLTVHRRMIIQWFLVLLAAEISENK